jgi:GntR family transcriptional repressor for pyruvate dehydrogenase complex
MLVPLKKARLYEEIIKQLLELIRKGDLKPGDRLSPERELAIQLNVSRTAIREALRSMEMMGFIDSKVGGGTFIRQVTLDNIIEPFSGLLSQDKKLMMELIEVRMLLETEIAKLAATRINEEKAFAIEESIKIMEKEISEGGIGLKGDNAFHDSLSKASENAAMGKILNMCGDLLSSTREATLRIPGQPLKSIDDHRKIFEAVKSGDEKKAGAFMKEHLTKAYKNLQQSYTVINLKRI